MMLCTVCVYICASVIHVSISLMSRVPPLPLLTLPRTRDVGQRHHPRHPPLCITWPSPHRHHPHLIRTQVTWPSTRRHRTNFPRLPNRPITARLFHLTWRSLPARADRCDWSDFEGGYDEPRGRRCVAWFCYKSVYDEEIGYNGKWVYGSGVFGGV